MTDTGILYPLFVQIALTFVLLLAMGGARVSAVRDGQVRVGDIALRQDVWPQRVRKLANSFQNQLETPILFYTVVLLALFSSQADSLLVMLAWAFALSRLLHAYIHVTSNNVLWRFRVFVLGVSVLMAMWIIVGTRILIEGA